MLYVPPAFLCPVRLRMLASELASLRYRRVCVCVLLAATGPRFGVPRVLPAQHHCGRGQAERDVVPRGHRQGRRIGQRRIRRCDVPH